MTNVIQFHAESRTQKSSEVACEPSAHLTAALCARARDALSLITEQFELALQHARFIEPRIQDPKMRQLFAERIELTRRLLDVAQLKILLLQFGSPTDHGRPPSLPEK